MISALLPNNILVSAASYDEELHGTTLHCMDRSCKAPVFFVNGGPVVTPHFKTSGKGASIHNENCGFARPLTFQESVAKVSEYQSANSAQGIRETVVRLNMNDIDPDFERKTIERNPGEPKPKDESELDKEILKEKKDTPSSISSLKTVKKLFTSASPDVLAKVIISVKGQKVPISSLIQAHKQAHDSLWNNEALELPYFIHGTVERITRREKVWYITIGNLETGFFSLVVFDRHFHHFTYKDDQLIGKDILAYGYLRKNDYHQSRKSTELIIKSNKYIEFL